MFGTIKSFVNNKGSLKDAINFKRSAPAQDDESGEESWSESFRRSSEITLGTKAYFNSIARDLNKLIYDLEIEDRDFVYEILEIAKPLIDEPIIIDRESRLLASWVTDTVLPVKAYRYLERRELVNMLVVAYVKVYELGFTHLANFILVANNELDDTMTMPIAMSWIRKDLVQELEIVYPLSKETMKAGKILKENTAAEIIRDFTDRLQAKNNIFLASIKYIPTGSKMALIYSEIRNDLAELLITLKNEK